MIEKLSLKLLKEVPDPITVKVIENPNSVEVFRF